MPLAILGPEETRALTSQMLADAQAHELEERGHGSFAFLIDGLARSRANVHRQREGVSAATGCFRTLVRSSLAREALGRD